jgi:hypothetical protein
VAVDVGVDDADLEALLGHRQGEVDGDRRLADAALAAGDREHLGERAGLGEGDLALGLPAAEDLLEAGALLGGHHAQGQVHVGDAGDAAERPGDVTGDRLLERAPRHREQHGQVHDPAVVDVDRVDHAELGDRALDLGVVDGRQGGVDLLKGRVAHDAPS